MSPASFSLCIQTLAFFCCMKRIWISRVACEIVEPNVRSTLLLGGRVGGCLSNGTGLATQRTIDVSARAFFFFFLWRAIAPRRPPPLSSPQGPNVNSACVHESQRLHKKIFRSNTLANAVLPLRQLSLSSQRPTRKPRSK